MRFKEFEEKIEDWGRKYDDKPIIKINGYSVLLKMTINGKYKPMVRISSINSYELDTTYLYFSDLANDEKQDLFKIVTEFAATKPEDREDEKLFYLKNTSFFTHDYDGYLNFDNCEFYMLNSRDETKGHKTKFTLEEIEEIKKKFNTTLEDFELIEVDCKKDEVNCG